jgi:hypothetical protein
MREINRGSTTCPRFANAVYAATKSSGLTPDAPRALDGNGAMGVSIPTRDASAETESMPINSPTWTDTVLRDFTSPSRIVIGPMYTVSTLRGSYAVPSS